MARRVAQDLPDGAFVNLGIGMPTMVSGYVPAGREVIYHSENGILGLGRPPEPHEVDPELIDAGKNLSTLLPGASYFHHTDSFLIMRGGHLDVSVLGAFQVSATGDLANWATDDVSFPPAVGGAMDLAVGAKRVLVLTTHTTSRRHAQAARALHLPAHRSGRRGPGLHRPRRPRRHPGRLPGARARPVRRARSCRP